MSEETSEETITIPIALHIQGMDLLGETAVFIREKSEQLARERADLHRACRELDERGHRSAAAQLQIAIDMIGDIQIRMVRVKNAVFDLQTKFRACDPNLTPVDPIIRRQSQQAFKAAAAHLELAGQKLRGE